ncbi:hypothetical protein [Polyangium jinanense]|uniref:Uncharacterized protein n=1 Tax=Polyangium jinanense TaxID=2829994 RepID=A0A9X3X5U3_9BACT|nr:hypothetical protein [Polyangium jinanense]MDC3983145.1 hypothetical protein [Polyangium jinanense]
MKKRAFPRAASVALVALAACSAKPERPGASAPPPSPLRPKPTAAPEPLLGPARYVLAEGVGVSFDEAGRDSALPRREPALASGHRFLLDGGLVLAEAPGPEALYGFRSLPARLGGGYVFWSDARTYRADTFLGELRPIAQIAAEGGARPWLDTLVLRTDLGLLELDPRAATPDLRRTDLARFAEAFSLDGKHGVRLDAFGRAEITTDGGKTFRDLTAERSVRIFALEEGESGKLLLLTGAGRQPTLALDPAKGLVPVVADPPNDLGWGMMTSPTEDTLPSSRRLAPPELATAVFAGARLPGGRVLVTREQSVRVLALATGQVLDDAPLTNVAEPFAHCQPIPRGADVLLACTHSHGAHVLALQDDPSAPRLEATFPEPSTFIAGQGPRFAFTGRCGALVPTAADFRGAPPVNDAQPKLFGPSEFEREFTTPPADPPEPLDPTPADEAYVCVRSADGAWTERRLTGEDATHLYRFLPGDGGTATALVFRSKDTKTASKPAPEGVRILHVDPEDPALGGAAFPAAPTPMEEPPYRSIDRDFWLDEKDGSIHGWIVLPPEDESAEDAERPDPIPQGRSERMLPVSTRLGGRFAGVHIHPDGRVEVHPLPPGVVEVIRGGPFALARADNDGAATYHESTDGGRTFRPVVAPPVGELNAPYDANMVQGCSELGCALGDGVVRLGWGSPAPAAPLDTPPDIASAPEPPVKRLGSLPLRCRLERPGAPAPRGDSKADAAPLPASLRTPPGVAVGLVRAGSFTVDVGLPFDPRPPRRATFKAPSLTRVEGAIVPVLLATDASPVGLFLRTPELRFDLGLPGSPSRDPVPLQHNGVFTAAADLGRGDLLTLQAGDGELFLLRGGLLRRFTQMGRVPDVTRHRLGLARRRGDAASPRLAVSAVSGTSGDILLADLDLARATLGPVRAAGSLTNLDPSPACRPDPDAYRLLAEVLVDVQFDPPDPDHDAPSLGATALVAVSTGRTCLEGLEVRFPRNNTTLVVRFPSPGASLVRGAGRSDAGVCSSP